LFLEVLLVSPESCVNPTDSFLVFLGVIPAVTYTNSDLVKQGILERSTRAARAAGYHLLLKNQKKKEIFYLNLNPGGRETGRVFI
jgi:hypothetical protein